MLRGKKLLISIGLIMLAGIFATASFSLSHDDVSDAASTDFDLAAALDQAVSGSSITLTEDAILLRNATVKAGVTLDDSTFSLTITNGVKLTVEGSFIIKGGLLVGPGAQIIVASGGLMTVNNGTKTAEISGTLEIKQGGTLNIGQMTSSTLDFDRTGVLIIDGLMNVGYGSISSTVNVWKVNVYGELRVSSGSNFVIKEIMNIGRPPTLTTDRYNIVISGRVTLEGSALILVYGDSSFSPSHIKNSSVSTKFIVLGKTFATEYADSVSKPNIVLPTSSNLIDYRITAWKDGTGTTVTDASAIKIGSGDINGEAVKRSYKITFTDDKTIRWVVNGTEKGSSFEENAVYGTSYTVNIKSAPGYKDLPIIFKGDSVYTRGTSFVLTEDLVFRTYAFDLAKELDRAVAGDTVSLLGETTLLSNATIKPGVTLDDKGFSLLIPAAVTLTVEGKFDSTGKLTVDVRGSIIIASGGEVFINNTDEKKTEVSGTLDVGKNGTLFIGNKKASTFECLGNGRLTVEGTMKVGLGALNSSVFVRNATVTGNIQISDGSVFRIYDVLTIGSAPVLITEIDNPASITGKFTLDTAAYILVYGKSDFTAAKNIRYPAVSTAFKILGEVYATLYKDQTGKRAITVPSTSSLKDYRLINWKDASDNIITNASNIQIGSVDIVFGEVVKRTYAIILKEDKNIKWVVNGLEIGSSGEVDGVYGSSYTVYVRSAPGKTELPGILRDGQPFTPGSSFIVTAITEFATTNKSSDSGNNLLIPMLIVIVAMIAALAAATVIMKKKAKEREAKEKEAREREERERAAKEKEKVKTKSKKTK